eukprot:scaffold1.g5360.t1
MHNRAPSDEAHVITGSDGAFSCSRSIGSGDVLEVSCGTGRNLKYFDLRSGSAISSLTLTDSNREMLQHAWDKYRDMMRLEPAVPVRFTLADAQALSGGSGAAAGDAAPSPPPRAPGFGPQFAAPETFATAQFDTVVETFGLCSCSDPVQSLKEMARVCKPGGRILLLEHGRGTWDWVNGVLDAGEERHCARWGCQWNRPILELVAAAGLEVESGHSACHLTWHAWPEDQIAGWIHLSLSERAYSPSRPCTGWARGSALTPIRPRMAVSFSRSVRAAICTRHGLLWRAIALLVCAAAALPPAGAQAPPAAPLAERAAPVVAAGNSSAAGGSRSPFIVVFRDSATLAKQRVMCGRSAALYRLFAPGLGLPLDCHMPTVCRRFYTNTIFGFHGMFSDADMAKLQRCLPGAIFYAESDGMVHKAEDDDFWHPPESTLNLQQPAWRIQQQQQQQQQAASADAAQRWSTGRRGMLGSGGGRPARAAVQVAAAEEDEGPRVAAFDQATKAPASEGGTINRTAFEGMGLVGMKREAVPSRLWSLDRIDQRELPLDGAFNFGAPGVVGVGLGTTVCEWAPGAADVVDSGIKPNHQEFKSWDGARVRASYGYGVWDSGRDFVENDLVADDCDGHGTHVAATAVGLQVGVAKDADVVGVRILDCTGSGTISDTVAGLDWVAANHKAPAIVTLSLGIQVGGWSRVLEDTVRSLVNDHGITVVVASGNSAVDACYVAPANVPEVISVAASNLGTKYSGTRLGDDEAMYKWSNTGPCVDIFAPGVDIYSACGGAARCDAVTDSAYTYASGTSMAVPAVAGVAATYLAQHPDAQPRVVQQAIIAAATSGKVNASLFKPGTPNRLLYSRLDDSTTVQAASGPNASKIPAWGGGTGTRLADAAAARRLQTVQGAKERAPSRLEKRKEGAWGFAPSEAPTAAEAGAIEMEAATPPGKPVRQLGFGASTPPDATNVVMALQPGAAATASAVPPAPTATLSPDGSALLHELASHLRALACGGASAGSPAEAFALGLAVGLGLPTPARRRSAIRAALTWVAVVSALVVAACSVLLLLVHAEREAQQIYYS